MSHHDNLFIQIRALLQSDGVKLWEEPYYSEDLGSIEGALENLALKYSGTLSIDIDRCKFILTELQENALRTLAARREFSSTGIATLKVRRIDQHSGATMVEVKCSLDIMGSELLADIAKKLEVPNAAHVKCIASGKVVSANATLADQKLNNNQQLIVIVGDGDNTGEALYERINRIRTDVQAVVSSKNNLIEMEDQNGSQVYLPPSEHKALLMGMGFCEKARAAMNRKHYEEALLLLLEADEHFATCNSKFLESVDNYALLNLDIVWCYFCLKNITQLPDAERRLAQCSRNFGISYGDNFERLYSLKGKNCPERALIMRLRLLQGVIFFHQNLRNQAFECFEAAKTLLSELEINSDQLAVLVDMGFDPSEARMALRSFKGGTAVEQAVEFIHERRQQLKNARKKYKGSERAMERRLKRSNSKDCTWVNPRSVCSLNDMGFESGLATLALQRANNDILKAVELLQTESDELNGALPRLPVTIDKTKLAQLLQLGFHENDSRVALENESNNMEEAIDSLMCAIDSEEELTAILKQAERMAETGGQNRDGPSTSTASGQTEAALPAPLIEAVINHARDEIETYKAYERFNSDLNMSDMEYLDLPLIQEEKILTEYFNMLQQ
ncbi:NEDD8 ultimate buster 1 [Drosophila mauritiana]|uniref:NEDD8 ultimate buster 1 n=1 Tax=Drosophila mauritiana TaxID=7226 RepID=A0A6P8L435_DROMA|nr:NEDD8 ultimate buster 1 [Drosophila mauritiana]XP_033170634.1 NEDD8 ultimate buster 1 [Drosophila mauritiana]